MSNAIDCSLAYNSVSIGSRGNLRPCCAFDTKHFFESKYQTINTNNLKDLINNEDLKQIRTQLKNGQWPKACNECKIKEANNGRSTRQIFNEMWPVDQKMLDNIAIDGSIKNIENIEYLDITLGNKCNLKCMTCSPWVSSLWTQEWQAKNNQFPFTDGDFHWYTSDVLSSLIQQMPKLTRINFLGGEPTLNKEHAQLLEKLIQTGRAGSVYLNYVTNLTTINNNLIDLWKNFYHVNATISVDGVDKVNEYIRFPLTWEKFTTNLENLKEKAKLYKISISWSHTISVFNICFLSQMFEWFTKQYYSCQGNYLQTGGVITPLPNFQRVHMPAYQNVCILPQEIKLLALEECKKAKLILQSWNISWVPGSQLDVIEPWIKEEPTNKQQLWQQFLDDIKFTDKYRKIDIRNHIPWMTNYL